jgi:SAM-dependent methyltransferase
MTNSETRDAAMVGAHPSFGWTTVLDPDPGAPRDAERFAAAMRHQGYPRASDYNPRWVFANLMGPNCLWLAEDLTRRMRLTPGQRVLDLGCGAALSSIFIAREYGAQVWAADLWIEPAVNAARAREAGVADRVFPMRVEAHHLPFAHGFFDAVVSIDAYHYFGTDVRYLSYLAQFVRPGGAIAMTSPANAVDPEEASTPPAPELLAQLGADWFTFRSADWWGRHWARTRGVAVEEAAMVEDGRDLWCRYLEAAEAWSGQPKAEQFDGRLLFSPEGQSLGFCRVIARRAEGTTLDFGPGEFATRIA